jgi:hypothetical protein
MTYGTNDIRQAALGAVVASLFIVSVRQEPISIDPMKGLIVGLIWIWIVTAPFINRKSETKIHAIGDTLVTLGVASVLSLIFELVEYDLLFTFDLFGSTPWIITWVALPTAIFFDKFNISNHFDRWYVRGRR